MLFALLGGWLWLALGRADWPRFYAAAAGGSLATAFVASFATYGIWQEWWEGTLSFSLFMVLVMARVASPGAVALMRVFTALPMRGNGARPGRLPPPPKRPGSTR